MKRSRYWGARFDYLTELDRHADELAAKPSDWMPWNYRATLAAAQPSPE
jgi:hypothetical protein